MREDFNTLKAAKRGRFFAGSGKAGALITDSSYLSS